MVPGGIAQELAQQQSRGGLIKTSLPLYSAASFRGLVRGKYDDLRRRFRSKPLRISPRCSITGHARTAPSRGRGWGVLDLAAYPTTVGVQYDIDQWSEELQLQGHAGAGAPEVHRRFIYAAAEIDVTDIPTVVGISPAAGRSSTSIITGPIVTIRRRYTPQGTYDPLVDYVPV